MEFATRKERDHFARENFGLVRKIAHSLSGIDSHEELFQTGIVGLMKAIDKFDPSRGIKFSCLAVPYIRGAILHANRAGRLLGHKANYEGRKQPLMTSLDTFVGEEEAGTTWIDLIPWEEPPENGFDTPDWFEQLYSTISERDRTILEQIYRDDRTHPEVAQEMGLTQKQLSTRIFMAKRKIRDREKKCSRSKPRNYAN